MTHILLAEDDLDFGNILKQYLEIHQFQVSRVYDGVEALEVLQKEAIHLCVLDVMMPNLDGFNVAEKVKKLYPNIPFIFLTARSQKVDKMKGLQLGADDYICKPFDADELVLRINNILSRSQTIIEPKTNNTSILKIGQYQFDTTNYTLECAIEKYRLTEREAALLQYLCDHKNKVVKRDDILKSVWSESDFFTGRSMDVFISRLRKYLKHDTTIQIKSIRGVGLEFLV